MTVVYTAGTTWLIAASETAHKKETKSRFLEQAEKCVGYLKEMGTYWETGARLEQLLQRVIELQRTKLDGTAPSKQSTPGTTSDSPATTPESPTTHRQTEPKPDAVDPTDNTKAHDTPTIANTDIVHTPPEVNLQDYFSHDMEMTDGFSAHGLFMNDADFTNMFEFHSSDFSSFGNSQIDPSHPARVDHQDQIFDFSSLDSSTRAIGSESVSESIDFGTNMDWSSIFGITPSTTSVDVEMMSLIHSELGMPAGGEFPLVPSSHIPGIFSQQQGEMGWDDLNATLK